MLFEIVYPNGDVELKRTEDLTTIIDGEVRKLIKYIESTEGVVGATLTSGVYVGIKQAEQK